jgi:hypothetical protein
VDVIKKHLKLVGTFLAGVLGNALYDIVEGNAPFPTTKEEWLRWGLTTLLASVGAYLPRNKQDRDQVGTAIVKDLNTEDTVAVTEVALDDLPDAVRENVLNYRRKGV